MEAQMVRRKEDEDTDERIEKVAVRRNDTVHRERCTSSDMVKIGQTQLVVYV